MSAPESEPNPDRQVSLHMGLGAAAISTKITSACDGFASSRTLSGRSLGSLEHYCMDWNSADMSEVSTANPQPTQHPAGPSMLARKMHAVKLAVVDADKTAVVIIFFTLFRFLQNMHPPQSPRFGLNLCCR